MATQSWTGLGVRGMAITRAWCSIRMATASRSLSEGGVRGIVTARRAEPPPPDYTPPATNRLVSRRLYEVSALQDHRPATHDDRGVPPGHGVQRLSWEPGVLAVLPPLGRDPQAAGRRAR